MIIYDKFGYSVKAFKKEDRIELFKYFTDYRLGNRRKTGISEYSGRRASLKMEVNEAINAINHNPLGLYKDKKLIGVCLTFVDKKYGNIPTIKYIHIDKDKSNEFGKYVMFSAIINILYPEFEIKVKNGLLKEYGKIVHKLPKQLGYSLISNEFKNKLNNYFKEK